MSEAELNEWLEEVETTIRGYSEELIQHLAMRDELEYEKEVKNSFISVLIDVQNRQKEHREMLKKKKKVKNTASMPHSRLERLHSSVSFFFTIKNLFDRINRTECRLAYLKLALSRRIDDVITCGHQCEGNIELKG